jgi:hypothetical protein
LRDEGLFVTTLFFDGDPRVCQTDRQEAGFYLADLERRHSSDRLILVGDGEKLIDPITGRLECTFCTRPPMTENCQRPLI